MIGTILLQDVSNGTIVAFEGTELLNADWTPTIFMRTGGVGGTYLILPLENITTKTTTGFTLTDLFETVEIFGTVSDADAAPAVDPDLAANAIITLVNLKSYLKKTDTVDDAFLKFWINNISGVIEDTVKSKVVQQSITGLIVDGNGESKLTLPRGYVPISQIGTGATPAEADIQYRGNATSTFTNLLGDIDNALISNITRDSNWIRLYGDTFPEDVQNIKLNLKLGYATVPTVFIQVCIEKVVEVYFESRRGGSRLGISSVSAGQETRNQNTSYYQLSDRHRAMLMPYTFTGYNTRNIPLYR